MKNKTAIIVLLIFTFLIVFSAIETKSNNSSVMFTYSTNDDIVLKAAIEMEIEDFKKQFYINLPSSGNYTILMNANGEKHFIENMDNNQKSPFYEEETVFMGLQRVLHITLYPLRNENGKLYYYDNYAFSIDFENGINKVKASEINSISINAEYSSPIKIQANETIPIKKFIKIEIDSTGIYKIDYNDLENAGMNPLMINPNKLCLFTPCTTMIPVDTPNMFVYRNPIKKSFSFIGDTNNIFEEDEYILFFTQSIYGDNKNKYNNYELYNNPYTNKNIYMLDVNSNESLLRNYPAELTFDEDTISPFNTMIFHYDSINPLKAGYGWVWKAFRMGPDSADMEYEFDFDIQSLKSNTGLLKLKIFFETNDTFSLEVFLNDSLAGTIGIRDYNTRIPSEYEFPVNNLENSNTVKIVLKNIDSYYKRMYLDEIRIMYKPDNEDIYDDIFTNEFNGNILNISSNENMLIYYKNSNNHLSELRRGEYNIKVRNPEELFIGTHLYKPKALKYVDNDNMYNFNGAEMIIITGNGMRNAVNTYKYYREESGVSVKVFEIDEIYNAFSLGIEHPASIKSLMYYAFANWKIKPTYLLFLGACTYDYKNILNPNENRNIVPIYEQGYFIKEEPLLTQSASNVTDRWFCTIIGEDNYIDVIPGRMTVLNEREARDVLKKIIDYETKMKIFSQNRTLLIADDEYSKRSTSQFHEIAFTRNAEYLSNVLNSDFHNEKIYLMDYMGDKQTYDEHWPTDPGEKRQVRFDIYKKLNEGVGFVYFYGHGANYTLAHEHILLYPDDTDEFSNLYNYPVALLGTCNAGQFDYDDGSIGDAFQKLPYSGFSAVFAAMRATYDGDNVNLMRYIFTGDLIRGDFNTLGEYYISMINTNNITNTPFNIIGDPAMQIRTRMNDIQISTNDTFAFGTIDTISFVFANTNSKHVSIVVYQPAYKDSHDYMHEEPYKYQDYNKTDGLIFRGEYNIEGESLSIEVPFPESLAIRPYYDNIEVTAIYKDNNIIHYGLNSDNYLLHLESDTLYNQHPILIVKSSGIEINDNIKLPSEYFLDIEVNDKYGIYLGNINRYLPQLTVNGITETVNDFIYNSNTGSYTKRIEIDSEQFTDTVSVSVYNNKLLNASKDFTVDHMHGVKYFTDFTLYPNPANEYVYVSFLSNGGGNLVLTLLNRNGGVLLKHIIPFKDGFNSFKFDISSGITGKIPAGIYIMKTEFSYFGRKDVITKNKKLVKVIK